MTTALVRAADVPYQIGRLAAEIEFEMVTSLMRVGSANFGLNQLLRRIEIKSISYTPLQQAIYEQARTERESELSPALSELKRNSRPYWETHGYLETEVMPNVTRIVMLMAVPRDMLDRYPQYAPVPRQEELPGIFQDKEESRLVKRPPLHAKVPRGMDTLSL